MLAIGLATTLVGVAAAVVRNQEAKLDPQATAFFESQVRPILVKNCYACHSAKSAPAQGGLLLDTKAGWQKGGASGTALVPGDPVNSTLIQSIQWVGPHKPMPPSGKLSQKDIDALVQWVKMGAPDPRGGAVVSKTKAMTLEQAKGHWAFQPLKKPTPPTTNDVLRTFTYRKISAEDAKATPNATEAMVRTWPKTSIDRFILKQHQVLHIRPNPAADRRTLIRRATLDLTGLPPTPEEIDAFTRDKSPNAWEKVIDRLLASPTYGERWARHWLDLSRFAESHGYEQDYDRPYAYHFRDFAIRAFNQDLPYDKFVKWQLAGDELEPDNPLALMATGFLAAGTHATQITKNQVEKERYDELDDMLNTTGVVFLGLTLGCARCHDHKYDPVSNKDYYRMLSTFTKTVRSDYDVNMDPEGYKAKLAAWDAEYEHLVAKRTQYEETRLPEVLGQAQPRMALAQYINFRWLYPKYDSVTSAGGATIQPLEDGSVLVSGTNPETETLTFTMTTRRLNLRSIRLEALSDTSLVKGGPGRGANGNFALTSIGIKAQPLVGGESVDVGLKNPRADFEQVGLPVSSAITGNKRTGWAVDPQFGKSHAASFEFNRPIGFADGTRITVTLKFENNVGHGIGRPRISFGDDAVETELLSDPLPEALLALPQRIISFDDPNTGQRKSVFDFESFNTVQKKLASIAVLQSDTKWKSLDKDVQATLARKPQPPVQKVLISSEGVTAIRTHTQGGDYLEQTHFLKRGDPNQKGAVATQSFLTVLMRDPAGEKHWQTEPPKDARSSFQRRNLAEWITDVDEGAGALLARVIVNRLWQRHFGRGLVRTVSDFGAQAEPPANPELLDWLAGELIRNGWRLKPIHKLMMTSATYMQSASDNPAKYKIDPENKFCWRLPRKRLEAEALRDSMLAVSGQLDRAMYGPGTLDENMRRRSIYFFTKRSKLIPTMTLFDAPNALQSLPVRATTTIAPQALMLMNSPQIRDWSLALAKRVIQQAPDNVGSQLEQAYRLALGRLPSTKEKTEGSAFLSRQAAGYKEGNASTANELALADLCQVLFSTNEFAYVE
jgi:mono/diheme cytochrome c family protein